MQAWIDMSLKTRASSTLSSWSRSAPRRSTAAPTASTCTPPKRGRGRDRAAIYLLEPGARRPCYSDRERAALAWTEALTLLSRRAPHEAAYDALAAQFTQEEQVKLTLLIGVINGWNRIAVGFGTGSTAGEESRRPDGGRPGARTRPRVSIRCVRG